MGAQHEPAFPTCRRSPVNATDEQAGVKPTIVLVHGAFADASSWNGVIERLQQQGYTVIATANPLRGLAADSAYTASLLHQIDGPVLLVGHSYAGAIITNAATSTPERRRPGLHRRLRHRGGRKPERCRERLQGQHPGRGPGAVPVSGRTGRGDCG